MKVPPVVAGLLRGFPDIDSNEQAFPFITVDDRGFPHVALLSRSETDVAPGNDAVLAVVASRRTRANLVRGGRAGLVAVAGTSAHYLKLRVIRTLQDGDSLGCVLEVNAHKEDSIGIPLVPMGFRATAEVARIERWSASADMLRRLVGGGAVPMS